MLRQFRLLRYALHALPFLGLLVVAGAVEAAGG